MPRRNSNADYHQPRWNHDRIFTLGRDISEPTEARKRMLKTTAEEIVRDYRRQTRSEAQVTNVLGHAVAEMRRKRARVAWYKAVNWQRAFEYACWSAAAVAIGYLIVVAFIPFFVLLAR